VSAFTLRYNNRLGSLAQYDTALDTFILYKTNIGDARTHGLELFAEYECRFSNTFNMSIFTSTAYFHARYLGDSLRINSKENRSISGNHLESVPGWISRNGVNFTLKNISISFLYSYTGSTFSDPLNTVLPSVSGATGKVPAYGLLDVNATYRIRNIVCRIGLNNATNRQYFTKRPTFYPGPGVWPSDGRSLVCSVAIRV
jgi:Fe(3+) dicitrate transport protein